jgi:ATP-binding cassette subfamily B (MDR/TAP) protein 1
MSEKVVLVVSFISAFITGFVLAYARCWRLALAMSSILPCVAFAGGFMNKFLTKFAQFVFSSLLFLFPLPHPPRRLSLNHVADGGSLAEEVISSVRTAHAFGTQKVLSSLYDVHIEGARVVDAKSAIFHGAGIGIFFFVIYAAYALGTESRR